MKIHFRGLAENALQFFRVFKPRDLHQNPIVALLLNRGFGHAEFVDAIDHDFAGLFHHALAALVAAFLGHTENKIDAAHVQLKPVFDVLDTRAGGIRIRNIPQCEPHSLILDPQVCVPDTGVALTQLTAHGGFNRLKRLLKRGVEPHAQQQGRTTLQIQSQTHPLGRQQASRFNGFTVRVHDLFGRIAEIRRRVQNAEQRNDNRKDHRPTWIIDHLVAPFKS